MRTETDELLVFAYNFVNCKNSFFLIRKRQNNQNSFFR